MAPPSLNPVVLGSNGTGGSLLYAPDGSLVSTVGLLPASGATAASPAASATPASPSASPTATPEGGITQTPDVPGSLVEFPRSGTPTQLAQSPPSAAAYSPNGGRYLAMAVDDGNGGSRIVVTRSDGTQMEKLATSSTQVTELTWATNDRIIYTDGTTIDSVDLSKAKAQLYTHTGSGTITALALGGAYAYVSPATATGGALLNINTGTVQVLTGAVTDVAFSGDGTIVAWVDESAHPARILTESIAHGASTQGAPMVVSTPDATATPSDIALDMAGDEIAYLSTGSASGAELVVAQLSSGTPLAVESPSNASQITLSPPGDQVAFVSNSASGASIEQATVPGATTKPHGPQIPAGANRTLQRFVQAQVGLDGHPDFATLAELSAPGTDFASSTPQDLSRAYVISTYLDQGVVGASIELIVDPSSGHTTARFASETLHISQGPTGGYVVTSAFTSQLRDQSAGPHVVQVSSSTANGVTILQVSFDSDLNPGSVASAIAVLSASGTTLASTAVYNPDTRTATVTIDNAPTGTLTLNIATTLADFKGQNLVQSFTTSVQASS